MNSYDLSGKTAIVTGGAGGIGRAIVQRLSVSGARVRVWDMRAADIPEITSTRVDVTQPVQIAQAMADLADEGTRVDILVNNAGYLGLLHPFELHAADDWQRIVQINLLGTLYVTQAMIPHMRKWGGGRILNMGSLAGKEGLAQLAAYSAASAGVIAFTKALGRELAGSSIYVNCIAPGPIDTAMIRVLGDHAVDGMIVDSPMQRLGNAEEVAHLVAWLCSDASQFNTGAVFDMSGGRARY